MRRGLRLGLVVAGLALGLPPTQARADHLFAEGAVDETGYSAVEELAFEAFVHAPDRGSAARLVLRTTLHNASLSPRDAVLTLAVPRGARLLALRTPRAGDWQDGAATHVARVSAPRDPGLVFARTLPPDDAQGLPAVQLIAWGLPSHVAIQVELELEVFPTLRGGRSVLELPSRAAQAGGVHRVRRVQVRDAQGPTTFSVEGRTANGPTVETDADAPVELDWPVRTPPRTRLIADLVELPRAEDKGAFELRVRLGRDAAPRPDHVVLVLDRSRSTKPSLGRDTMALLQRLLDRLGPSTTYDVIGFNRHARPLLGPDAPVRVSQDDEALAQQLEWTIDANDRAQGTDLGAAMETVATRLERARARRPLVLVVTDGMLPHGRSPRAIAKALRRGRAQRASVLIAVDDPLVARSGLQPDSALAALASELGARTYQGHLGIADVNHVLEAPTVLGELQVKLPARATLTNEVPRRLVAGQLLVLHGEFRGRTAPSLELRGKLGRQRLRTRVKPARRGALAAAHVVAIADPKAERRGSVEGFSLPDWHTPRMARLARLGVAQAGRGGKRIAGYVSRGIVAYHLQTRVVPRAAVCYRHALTRNPVAGGRVTLDIELGKGEIMLASVTGDADATVDAALIDCIEEAAWKLEVPAGQLDDRLYRVRYPLMLRPPENAKATPEGDPLGEGTIELLLDLDPAGSVVGGGQPDPRPNQK